MLSRLEITFFYAASLPQSKASFTTSTITSTKAQQDR
jgi:hypothetical protein